MPDYGYEHRLTLAKANYQEGLSRVATEPEPDGQKFGCGSRVKIAHGGHIGAGKEATVNYVHAHAYGGTDVKAYSLDVDGVGHVSWFDEGQLTAI